MVQAVNNPFFTKYNTPLGTPPSTKIKTEHYEAAFKEGILRLDKEIKTIADNPDAATFKNTIEALDQSGEMPKSKQYLLQCAQRRCQRRCLPFHNASPRSSPRAAIIYIYEREALPESQNIYDAKVAESDYRTEEAARGYLRLSRTRSHAECGRQRNLPQAFYRVEPSRL